LCVVGFGESIAALIHHDNVWISRGIAVGVLIVLLGEATITLLNMEIAVWS